MSLALDRDFTVSDTPRHHYPDLHVITDERRVLYVKHEYEHNVFYEAPLAKGGVLLYGAIFDFDWANAYRDFEYVQCVDPAKNKGDDGDWVLVKARNARILYRTR